MHGGFEHCSKYPDYRFTAVLRDVIIATQFLFLQNSQSAAALGTSIGYSMTRKMYILVGLFSAGMSKQLNAELPNVDRQPSIVREYF